jgi:putative flippase GtrA
MADLDHTLQSREILRSAGRFLVVGALGTLVDVALFAALHGLLGAPALAANTLSYSAGIANNYFLHRRWTYAHRQSKRGGRQVSQFVGVSLSAMAANHLIVLLLAPTLAGLAGDPAIGAVLAKLCATGVGMGWNFAANHWWTFRD